MVWLFSDASNLHVCFHVFIVVTQHGHCQPDSLCKLIAPFSLPGFYLPPALGLPSHPPFLSSRFPDPYTLHPHSLSCSLWRLSLLQHTLSCSSSAFLSCPWDSVCNRFARQGDGILRDFAVSCVGARPPGARPSAASAGSCTAFHLRGLVWKLTGRCVSSTAAASSAPRSRHCRGFERWWGQPGDVQLCSSCSRLLLLVLEVLSRGLYKIIHMLNTGVAMNLHLLRKKQTLKFSARAPQLSHYKDWIRNLKLT